MKQKLITKEENKNTTLFEDLSKEMSLTAEDLRKGNFKVF